MSNNKKDKRMDRAIKFKGKSTLTGQWLCGYLCESFGRFYINPESDRLQKTGEQYLLGTFYEVGPATVSQFTGEIGTLKADCEQCVYLDADKKIINQHIDKNIRLQKELDTARTALADAEARIKELTEEPKSSSVKSRLSLCAGHNPSYMRDLEIKLCKAEAAMTYLRRQLSSAEYRAIWEEVEQITKEGGK